MATAATFVYFAARGMIASARLAIVMPTFLRSRTFKYALIFLAWAAAVACVDVVDNVPFDWRPMVWPYTSQLVFLKVPGIVVMVATGAIHGFGSYAIDGSIVIFGSAVFWFVATIILIKIWSGIRRLLA